MSAFSVFFVGCWALQLESGFYSWLGFLFLMSFSFLLHAIPDSSLIDVPTDRAFLQHFARPENRCFRFHKRHRRR